jgi:hypothetical protein
MQEKYVLRVVSEVEAVPITPETANWAAEWCRGRLMREVCPDTAAMTVVGVSVATQYGVKIARLGDYLVKKMSGDFTTIDAQGFNMKYIRVN